MILKELKVKTWVSHPTNSYIIFDEETLIKSTLDNYLKNNNLSIDDITFEIALNEVKNIVTVKIYTMKNLLNANSEASYTFSYQVIER